MNITLAFTLIVLSQQQIIWVDNSPTDNLLLRSVTTEAIVFYDESNKVRFIILNPSVPTGKYNISSLAFDIVSKNIRDNKITKSQVTALAKTYRQTSENITSDMTRENAQNLLVNRTSEILGNNLTAWTPILDILASHMKSIANRLPSAKEMSEYYLEIAIGLEAASK